jgi:hypothetical protein
MNADAQAKGGVFSFMPAQGPSTLGRPPAAKGGVFSFMPAQGPCTLGRPPPEEGNSRAMAS